MEDSIDVILQDQNTKFLHRPQDSHHLSMVLGGLLVGFYRLWTMFVQPGFRKVPIKLQVPYLPSSTIQTQNVMKLLEGRKGCLADLGSGDGRLILEDTVRKAGPGHYIRPSVQAEDAFQRKENCGNESHKINLYGREGKKEVFAASSLGLQSTGFEINSILLTYARSKAWWKGIPTYKATFVNKDFWKTDLSRYNNVTVFLAPGVMEVLEEKLLAELPDGARVISCRFPFQHWPSVGTEGAGLDQVWAYDINAVRRIAT